MISIGSHRQKRGPSARSASGRVLLVLAALLLGTGPMAHAVTRTWSVSSNGWWVVGSNWGGTAPTSSDSARINNGYTAWIQPGDAAVCDTLYLGYSAGQSGYVSQWGGTFSAASAAHIGNSGTGGFALSGSGSVDVAGSIYIGDNSAGDGTLTLSDTSSISADNYIVVGASGTGHVTQYGGTLSTSTVSNSADLELGSGSSSHGYYTMSGGIVNTCDLYVGQSGTGVFTQSGGTVNVGKQGTADHHLYLASNSSGNGTYRLSGTGVIQLSKNNNGSTIFVADSSGGTGRFEWFRSGGITRPSGGSNPMMNIAATGTLAMGYDFNVSTLASGGYISLTGLNLAGLEVTNGATATHNQDDWTVARLRIGSSTGAGTYTLGGGGSSAIGRVSQDLYLGASGNLGTLNINANGQAVITGNIIGQSGASTINLNRNEGLSFGTSLAVDTFNIGPTSAAQFTLNSGKTLSANYINVGSSVSGTLSIGAQNVSVGTLTLKQGAVSGTSGVITATSLYRVWDGTVSAKLAGGVDLTKQTSGNVTLSNSGNSYGGTTYINAGKLIVAANGCLGTQYGHVEFDTGTLRTTASFETARDMNMNAGGGAFEVDSGTTLSHRGVIGGAGSLTKTGSGVLYLYTTANNWGGGTYINGGELWTGNSSVIPNNLVSISSAKLNLVSHTENIGALTLSGGTVAASGGSLGLGGDVTSSGTSSIGDSVALGGNRNFNVTGGVLTVGGAVSGSGQTATLSGAGNARILMAAAGTSNASYVAGGGGGGRMLGGDNTFGTAAFTGNITLNTGTTLAAKSGGTAEFSSGTWNTNNNAISIGASDHTGTVKLSNDLSTTAAVNVNYGTLWVNNNLSGGGSDLSVAYGATLKGTGTISKPVVVNGTVAPGSSIGTLHVNSTLSLSGISQFEINPDPTPSNDKIDQVTMLRYAGTLNVTNLGNPANFAAGQTYDLFDFSSESGTFSSINLPSLPGGLQWKLFDAQRFDYTTGQIVVESTLVPDAHYGLSIAAFVPQVLLKGNVPLSSAVQNTGSPPMDTLDFTGLTANSSAGGSVSGPGLNGTNVGYGETRTNAALTFTGTDYNAAVGITPAVASATNHTYPYGPAVLDWSTPATVNVGLAKAGPGMNRMVFGPPLIGQGAGHGTGPRDYAGLASKTLPGTWEELTQTLGTEAVVPEGTDTLGTHTVSMQWRQRWDDEQIVETIMLKSDVLNLTGMDFGIVPPWPQERRQSDVFTLEMSYLDPGRATEAHALMYLDLGDDHQIGGTGPDADRWLGAKFGNFGGTPQPILHMTWGEFRALYPGPLSDLVGYCGWMEDGPDTGRAWAVVDYNNAQFAVPEPGTLLLLAIGAAVLLGRWRRARRFA